MIIVHLLIQMKNLSLASLTKTRNMTMFKNTSRLYPNSTTAYRNAISLHLYHYSKSLKENTTFTDTSNVDSYS
jgi:hypothetical protein